MLGHWDTKNESEKLYVCYVNNIERRLPNYQGFHREPSGLRRTGDGFLNVTAGRPQHIR
jgi:hypothetical protein